MEQTDCAPPQTLTLAKQVLLNNKNGNSAPLQKRLITLMPLSSAQTMASSFHAPEIQGAIVARRMTAVHTQLRVEVDRPGMQNQPLIGIKPDSRVCVAPDSGARVHEHLSTSQTASCL